MITFNKPFLTGKETHYIYQAVYQEGQLSGNGKFTKLVHEFFEKKYYFKKTLMTTSCTDALEMSGLLMSIQSDDEIILPSFTFVSTANAFALRGAKLRFVDSSTNHPNIYIDKIEELINEKTKAIIVVHYAGIAVDMDRIMELAKKYSLFVVEDAAQAIDSFYKGRPLGGIGDFGTFSFHETKNIQSGEGGLLTINNPDYIKRSEIIWEKGTNRAAFFRGEVNKYGWVDIGSSFLPSELVSAFLYAQLEHLKQIQNKRISIWKRYFENLRELEVRGVLKLPFIPNFATNNGHLFYILTENEKIRNSLMDYLNSNQIKAVFHYLPLHDSDFFRKIHDGRKLPNADRFSKTLLRLPLFYEITYEQIDFISEKIFDFFKL